MLVTGHTGFKGSWLSIWLHELGAEVIGVAQDPFTERDNFVLSGIGQRVKADIRADIRAGERIKEILPAVSARDCVPSGSPAFGTSEL